MKKDTREQHKIGEKARKKKDVFLNGRPKKRITKMRVFVHIE